MCGLCGKDAAQTQAWVELEVFAETERELGLAEPVCGECVRAIVERFLELPQAA